MRIDQRGAVVERHNRFSRGPEWEYRSAKYDLDADLTQHGAAGWELVAVVPVPGDSTTAIYYFKRRRQQ